MQKLFKIPLLFLFIAALMGLFLRYMMFAPVPGVTFAYVLHGHSHVMFLGWLFNALMLAFVTQFTDEKNFKTIFWTLQIFVVGMLISFPLQGYGLYSIIFSTLHIFGAFVFIFLFFKSVKGNSSLALLLAKIALLFFIFASIGPFYLGYLQASGLGKSNWYRFSIYFYLHFQYNGFFYFGVLSLFIKLIESKLPDTDLKRAKLGCYLQVAACLPAYFLSVLWAQPSPAFNTIGLLSAILQLAGFAILLRSIRHHFTGFNPGVGRILIIVGISVFVKMLLQIVSAFPAAALFANEFRPIVIAYLHLVLVGVISLFVFAWLIEKQILSLQNIRAVVVMMFGFIGSELLLVYLPWNFLLPVSPAFINQLVFWFSAFMVAGMGYMLTTLLSRKSVPTVY